MIHIGVKAQDIAKENLGEEKYDFELKRQEDGTCDLFVEGEESVPMMEMAISSAMQGITKLDGSPFGAMVSRNGVPVSVKQNTLWRSKDPTCHAEINVIQEACRSLKTHDLSDCELITSCEPCPMCLGGANWARMRKVVWGVNQVDAHKYGFYDQVFYAEVEKPPSERSMTTIVDVMAADVERRLLANNITSALYFNHTRQSPPPLPAPSTEKNEFMEAAIEHAIYAQKEGLNKTQEPFAAVIVKDGKIVSKGHSQQVVGYDATATAEMQAIRWACKALDTHDLSGCKIYCTVEPDVMGLSGIYWANIGEATFGARKETASKYGFFEHAGHYYDLKVKKEERTVPCFDGVMKKQALRIFQVYAAMGRPNY